MHDKLMLAIQYKFKIIRRVWSVLEWKARQPTNRCRECRSVRPARRTRPPEATSREVRLANTADTVQLFPLRSRPSQSPSEPKTCRCRRSRWRTSTARRLVSHREAAAVRSMRSAVAAARERSADMAREPSATRPASTGDTSRRLSPSLPDPLSGNSNNRAFI